MSQLLDKQVNAQKEKNLRGSRKLPQAHEKKCAMKMKQTRKNNARVKMLLMEGSTL